MNHLLALAWSFGLLGSGGYVDDDSPMLYLPQIQQTVSIDQSDCFGFTLGVMSGELAIEVLAGPPCQPES